jgi:hypothetical protein
MAKSIRSKRIQKNKAALNQKVFKKIELERLEQVVLHEKEKFATQIASSMAVEEQKQDSMAICESSSAQQDQPSRKKANNRSKRGNKFDSHGLGKKEASFN